jgi:hypothetical protein
MSKEHPQFNPAMQAEALKLIESVPWGDMHYWIRDVEDALRQAFKATAGDYKRWWDEFDGGQDRPYDEIATPTAVIAQMPDGERHAYVAGLIRALGRALGIGGPIGEVDPTSLAGLLHGLNDLFDREAESVEPEIVH